MHIVLKRPALLKAQQVSYDPALIAHVLAWAPERFKSVEGRLVMVGDANTPVLTLPEGYWIVQESEGVFDAYSPEAFAISFELPGQIDSAPTMGA